MGGMNDRAVMRQALEALKGWKDEAPASWGPSDDAAVAALEAALMEPVVVQEPVVEIKPPNPEGATQCIVRWMAETPAGWVGAWDREALQQFVTPPRREWQGLTENELGELMSDSCGYPMCPNGDDLAFARAIEAALKEKNNG